MHACSKVHFLIGFDSCVYIDTVHASFFDDVVTFSRLLLARVVGASEDEVIHDLEGAQEAESGA